MEVIDLKLDKEVFTAKGNEGFHACFRVDNGFFISEEVFPKALLAANMARKFKKAWRQAEEEVEKSKETDYVIENDLETKQDQNPPKLKLSGKLYTHDEAELMPLTNFQEVWVITRNEDYVSDALNHAQKKLVSFTKTQDAAKRYGCHEDAKRVMRVLKGTVGPGFSLQRFFVSAV